MNTHLTRPLGVVSALLVALLVSWTGSAEEPAGDIHEPPLAVTPSVDAPAMDLGATGRILCLSHIDSDELVLSRGEQTCPPGTGPFHVDLPPAFDAALATTTRLPYCLQVEDLWLEDREHDSRTALPPGRATFRVDLHGPCFIEVGVAAFEPVLIDGIWLDAFIGGVEQGDVLPQCDWGDFPGYEIVEGPPCILWNRWPALVTGERGSAWLEVVATCSAHVWARQELAGVHAQVLNALDALVANGGDDASLRAELEALRDELAAYELSPRIDPHETALEGELSIPQQHFAVIDALGHVVVTEGDAVSAAARELRAIIEYYDASRGCEHHVPWHAW